MTLHGYGGHKLSNLGVCELECSHKGAIHNLQFHVVDVRAPPILGLKSCVDMKLVKLILSVDDSGATVDTHRQFSNDDVGLNHLLAEYYDLFDGIGEFPGEHSLTLHPDDKSAVHPPRRGPVALRDKVKEELARMEKFDIITKVTEPTDWVNSMFVVHQSNGYQRVCLDPRDLNADIKRQYYPVPTLEDVTSKLAGARHFSALDSRSGHWQIKLADSTSRLTTFNTPFGRYRYLVCFSA